MHNLMLANHLFDSIQLGASEGTPTPTEIGNEIFRDHLQRQSRHLNEKGSPDSLEELAQLGIPPQELHLPASARPLLESFLKTQGLTPDEIEPLIRSASDRDGTIHLGRLVAKIWNAIQHADARSPTIRSPDAPAVEALLFKMGLGAGEVKEIRDKAISVDGRLLMADLSSALNKHLSGHVSEEGLTSLFSRFGIEMELQANDLGALDRNLRDVLEALRETSSRATREGLKFQIAGLLREKGIPPQEVKSFLDTLSVAHLEGRERKPIAGSGAKLVNGLVLEDRPQWQHGTWRDAIMRILDGKGWSLSEQPSRGSFAPNSARWPIAGPGSPWVANPERALSKGGWPVEQTLEVGPQRRIALVSRADQGHAQSGKVADGVFSAHPEPAGATLEATSAQQTRPSTGLPHPLPKILDRMVWMIRGGEQRSRIHVSPPELGRLDIEVYVRRGGQIQASVGAETLAVKELIESNLVQLRQQLAEHGFSVDSFDVMVGLRDQGSPRGETRTASWRGEGAKKRRAGVGAVREEREPLSLPRLGRHQIDLHV